MRTVITIIRSFPADTKVTRPRGYTLRSYATFFTAVAVLYAVIISLSAASPARAGHAGDGHNLSLPDQYGTIIYRANEQSPGQLFIVGISHRDAENRLNHHNTAQVQLEVFRIGEWLHKNQGLELLLPEGYFEGDKDGCHCNDRAAAAVMDADLLYARLADDSRFVNAEMLLLEQFHMHAAQVEDKDSYNAVCTCLGELGNESCKVERTAKLDELQYLQEMRTARMLQKIPSTIKDGLHKGTTRKPSAMMTIGLNHIQDIIRYLQENTITITPPEGGNGRMESYAAQLDLLREGYGITVIIPRTLADDRQLLEATGLERILPKVNPTLAANEPALPRQ